MNQPFIPQGDPFAPTARVVVPANGTATAQLRAWDGDAFGILRLVPDAPEPSRLLVRVTTQSGTVQIFPDVHLSCLAELFRHRALRHPILVEPGQALELTFTNLTGAAVTVGVVAEGLTSSQLTELRAHRDAAKLPWREAAFAWGDAVVNAGAVGRQIALQRKPRSLVLTRLAVGVSNADGTSPASTRDVTMLVRARGRDLMRGVTPEMVASLFTSRELVPGIQIAPTDDADVYVDNAAGVNRRVTVLAEAVQL